MDVEAALDLLAVPAPPPGSVQSFMARFSDGDDHRRRRTVASARLSTLDPGSLRSAAFARTASVLSGRNEVDVMVEIARVVPVAVLAAALGATDVDTAVLATRRLCLALAPPEGSEPADGWAEVRVVASLLGLGSGDEPDEEAVNVVALLFQAMDATAGLIGNALRSSASPGPPPLTVVSTLRVTPSEERRVVELAALPFGAGRHRCPGETHALALAGGVLDALAEAGAVVVDAPDTDEPRANLRIPTRVVVRLTS